MNVLSSWLREWVNPEVGDQALADQLTMAGLEVDGVESVAPAFTKVVVGHVISCEKHPDADKLNLCQVNVGASEPVQIICGASNVRADLKVIVATVGAKLPGDFKIKKAKLRGVESFGMICSEAELGMAASSDGIAELPADAPIGEDIRRYLNLDDNIIELDITPNRGDCFSILGVARETACNYNLSFELPKVTVEATIQDQFGASVSNTQACPKYLTRVIKGVNNSAVTPSWMADKLTRSGHALHSPAVDITNFVLMELGQPMHAFDLSKIEGEIDVRMAKAGEELELLNDSTVALKDDTLVIADDAGALAIAGVMGGMRSSTQPDSSDILLESAFFEPVSIAGKAREYGLHTESSLRFERGVDFEITELAMARATELVLEICGGQAGPVNTCLDESALPELNPITISKDKIQSVLGFELERDWIEQQFTGLDFEITAQDEQSWTIVPPSFRFDIRIPADLIEELARLYGYDKLPVQKLSLDADINTLAEAKVDKYDLSYALVNRGYQEVITYSFISEKYQSLIDPEAKQIALANPISSDMSIMRSSLFAGLLQSVEANQRRGHHNARFFETGLCFNGIQANEQSLRIAGVISGNRHAAQWAAASREVDFFDLKADVEALLAFSKADYQFVAFEHPALQKGQSAQILREGQVVGMMGSLSPVVQKALSLSKCYLFELDLASIESGSIAKYQAFSQYQKSDRDIALVLDQDTPADALIQSIKALGQVHLIEAGIFDVYQGESLGENKKSIALNLSYQSSEDTLTDEQVNTYVEQVIETLANEHSAVLR